MKRVTMILAAAAMFLAAGCEKKTGSPDEVTRFEKDIDGPPCVLTVLADENLLADQSKLARAAADSAAGPGRSPATPTSDAIPTVKRTMSKVIAAAESTQVEQTLGFYTDADAEALRPVLTAVKEMSAKIAALEKLVQDKLGMSLPAEMKQISDQAGAAPVLGGDLANLEIDQLQFEADGENVVVTGPANTKFTFVDTPQGWKMQLDPQVKQLLSVFGDMFIGMGKVIDEITADINSGDVTKENFEARTSEIIEKHFEKAMEKFAKVMAEMMSKGFEPPKPVTPPDTPKPDERRRPRPRDVEEEREFEFERERRGS